MGVASGVGAGLGALAGIFLGPAGLALSGVTALGGATAGAAIGGAAGSSIDANQAAQKAKGQQNALMTQQQAQAAQLQSALLSQPKAISPDNFLSTQAAQLAKLRLGLASTITGSGGLPSPVLSAPSLTPQGGGKSKMGQ